MSMDRRDFVKHLALLAAGAAALPQQIAAFEHYYETNTLGDTNLAAVDEIMVCGMGDKSLPVDITLWVAGEVKLSVGCNLFGGIVLWQAMPDQKIVAPANQIKWQIKSRDKSPADHWLKDQFTGLVSFIGQDVVRRTVPLLKCVGNLA